MVKGLSPAAKVNLRTVQLRALDALEQRGVVMRDDHFDYGNGFHGRVYLNPHAILGVQYLLEQLAEDLRSALPQAIPGVLNHIEVVAGPDTGGAMLARFLATFISSHRPHDKPVRFVRIKKETLIVDGLKSKSFGLQPYYADIARGTRALLVDDVRNSGNTFRKAELILREVDCQVLATAEIYDRMEASQVPPNVPNFALAEYDARGNTFPAVACPMCKLKLPIRRF